jgi:hypothetical protein
MKHSTHWYARKIKESMLAGDESVVAELRMDLFRNVVAVYAEGGEGVRDRDPRALANNALRAAEGELPYHLSRKDWEDDD